MRTGSIYGIVLAGGRSRRMGGGDKALQILGGMSLLARVVAALRPQCGGLVLNANGDPARLAEFDLPVAADDVAGFKGPLAGILAGLDWIAAHHRDVEFALSARLIRRSCPMILASASRMRGCVTTP
jgi:molybdopterin-guanine dinucleotide biosynthesis protein A